MAAGTDPAIPFCSIPGSRGWPESLHGKTRGAAPGPGLGLGGSKFPDLNRVAQLPHIPPRAPAAPGSRRGFGKSCQAREAAPRALASSAPLPATDVCGIKPGSRLPSCRSSGCLEGRAGGSRCFSIKWLHHEIPWPRTQPNFKADVLPPTAQPLDIRWNRKSVAASAVSRHSFACSRLRQQILLREGKTSLALCFGQPQGQDRRPLPWGQGGLGAGKGKELGKQCLPEKRTRERQKGD